MNNKMESLICRHCGKQLLGSEARFKWEHDKIKVWTNGKYKLLPRCVAKDIKRGTKKIKIK